MPKVKIFLIKDRIDADDAYAHEQLGQGIGDWDEISDEDLAFLDRHRYLLNHAVDGGSYTIVRQTTPVEMLKSVREAKARIERDLRKREADEEKRKAQEREKREAKKQARALTKAEREEYERLKKQNEEEYQQRLLDEQR